MDSQGELQPPSQGGLDLEALKKLESDLDHGDEVHTLVGFEQYGDNITELTRALVSRVALLQTHDCSIVTNAYLASHRRVREAAVEVERVHPHQNPAGRPCACIRHEALRAALADSEEGRDE